MVRYYLTSDRVKQDIRGLMAAANNPDKIEFVLRNHLGDLLTNAWLNKMLAAERLTKDEIPPHLLKFFKTLNPQELKKMDETVSEGWHSR